MQAAAKWVAYVAPAVLLASALAATPAGAQDLPAEGPFTINFTSTQFEPPAPIGIGPEREFGVFESHVLATNAEGRGLLHNLTGRCTGWFSIDRGAGTFEQHGHCQYIDPEGDLVWERFDFESQPLAPVRIASARWIGGTGKYDGLRGEFEIRVRPLRPASETVTQAIGSKQGTYRIAN